MNMRQHSGFLAGLALLVALVLTACSGIDKAESLHQEGDKAAAFEMAASLLEDDDPKVRLRAVKLIGRIGDVEDRKAGAVLQPRLKDEDRRIRREVVRILGRLRYEPAVEDLLDLVPGADEELVRALGAAFAEFGKLGIGPLVERYDAPGHRDDRAAYRRVLIQTGPGVADSLIPLLKGKSFFENHDTFDILKRIRNPRVATLMLPYLADEEVAEQVIHAIAQLGSGAVDPTLRGLRDARKGDDLRVIEAYLRILGELKDARAVETLESLSKHQSERIRDAVDRALFQIRGY
jgi:hypothetical protein